MVILCSETGCLAGWLDLSARAFEQTFAECQENKHIQHRSTQRKIHIDGIPKCPVMKAPKVILF